MSCQDDDDNPARNFSRMQQWYIPLHAYGRKARSLLTINQRVILAEDERIQKEGKESNVFGELSVDDDDNPVTTCEK